MKIETKYDFGQELWFVRDTSERVDCPTCRTSHYEFAADVAHDFVWLVRGTAGPGEDGTPSYGASYAFGIRPDFINEDSCFLSREKAEAECDRRNKEASKDA